MFVFIRLVLLMIYNEDKEKQDFLNLYKPSSEMSHDDVKPYTASIWDKVYESQSDAEKDYIIKAETTCDEDINRPPILEVMAKDRYFAKKGGYKHPGAGKHSSMSLRYTDWTNNRKPIRKVLTIGYGYNHEEQEYFSNLSAETKYTVNDNTVGMKIELSYDTLDRILNFVFAYYRKYRNKYNILARNCNSLVKNVLKEARKGKKQELNMPVSSSIQAIEQTDWDALEEAYNNHHCISPATVIKRSMKNIKRGSPNTDKYFLNLGYLGFAGIFDDKVHLPTSEEKFKKDAEQASQKDLNKRQIKSGLNYRKNDDKVIASIEDTAKSIAKAQESADNIINKSSIKNISQNGYDTDAMYETSLRCRTVSVKSRKIIQCSGKRHRNLDIFALKNATLFDSVANQMSNKDADLAFFSKFKLERYEYEDLHVLSDVNFSDGDSNKNFGDYKKGSYLLNNRIPPGMFIKISDESNKGKEIDNQKRRITSIINCLHRDNVIQAKKLYLALLEKNQDKSGEHVRYLNYNYKTVSDDIKKNSGHFSNKDIAIMMTEDICAYINNLLENFFNGFLMNDFGRAFSNIDIALNTSKFKKGKVIDDNKKEIVFKIKEILDKDDEDKGIAIEKEAIVDDENVDIIKDFGSKTTNVN